jgi:hypothetical protein
MRLANKDRWVGGTLFISGEVKVVLEYKAFGTSIQILKTQSFGDGGYTRHSGGWDLSVAAFKAEIEQALEYQAKVSQRILASIA